MPRNVSALFLGNRVIRGQNKGITPRRSLKRLVSSKVQAAQGLKRESIEQGLRCAVEHTAR
jgi:hypothetical protein